MHIIRGWGGCMHQKPWATQVQKGGLQHLFAKMLGVPFASKHRCEQRAGQKWSEGGWLGLEHRRVRCWWPIQGQRCKLQSCAEVATALDEAVRLLQN